MRGTWHLAAFAITAASAQSNDAFTVTKPAAGDTIAISEEEYGRATVKIEWTVPEAIAERPVRLSLMQGNSIEEMVEMDLIASGANNNGSYSFTSYLDNTAPSGCNYTILAKAWTSFSYSGYFTIINPEDSGLDTTWTCPVDVGRLKPTEGSYQVPENSTGGSAGTSGSDQGSAAESTAGDGSNSSNGSGRGVSTTTLAVAVTVPIVVLLIIFAVVLVLGIRRGWFVRKQDKAQHREGPTCGETARRYPHMQEQGKGSDILVGELHGHDRPHQSDGVAIHQLYDDDGRR